MRSQFTAGSYGAVPLFGRATILLRAVSNPGVRPSPDLDPLIDATERAIAKYGFRRTSMSDLAREMGVARSTLYRQVDSVDDALELVGSRVGHRFTDEWSASTEGGPRWWDGFVTAVVHAVSFPRRNPALYRLLRDEPEMLGSLLSAGGVEQIGRWSDNAETFLKEAMAAGHVRRVDTRLAGEHLVRSMVALAVCPPQGDLREAVELTLSALSVTETTGKPAVRRRRSER